MIGAASVALFLVAWQIAGTRSLLQASFISYPTEVLSVGVEMLQTGELTRHALLSLSEFVQGFFLAVAFGVPAGLIMGQSKRVRYLLDPIVMAFYTSPRVTLVPILVIWFGVGPESKVALVFLGAIFPVLVNTSAGVRQIDALWLRAVRSFGANWLQLTMKVVLPGSLPSVMAGIRLGLGRAIISVIVGEMYVSVAGLGRLLQVYTNAGRVAELIFLASLTALFGVLCVAGLRWLESLIMPWRRELDL
jgi:sulfonate transport system permease protein